MYQVLHIHMSPFQHFPLARTPFLPFAFSCVWIVFTLTEEIQDSPYIPALSLVQAISPFTSLPFFHNPASSTCSNPEFFNPDNHNNNMVANNHVDAKAGLPKDFRSDSLDAQR